MCRIEFKPRALKDLRTIDANDRARILSKIEKLEDDLVGDVKRLTNLLLNIGFGWEIIESYLSWKRNRR